MSKDNQPGHGMTPGEKLGPNWLASQLATKRAERGGEPLVSPPFPEIVGPFTLWSPMPDDEHPSWGLAVNEVWVSVRLADRDACLVMGGTVLAGANIDFILGLRDKYNRASRFVPVTVRHINDFMGRGSR